jgi:hypothetical protein
MDLFKKKDVIDSAGGFVEKIGDALDKNITNKEELAQARNEMLEIVTNFELEQDKIRRDVLLAEAAGSKLQRNWRPILMLTFGGIIVCTWVIFPLVNIFVKSQDLSSLIINLQNAEMFWDVVKVGVGGYVMLRSAEKIIDSAGKNMNINIGKK